MDGGGQISKSNKKNHYTVDRDQRARRLCLVFRHGEPNRLGVVVWFGLVCEK